MLHTTQFEQVGGLDQGNFDLLDGSMQSIHASLDIIRALLNHAPSPLIWVIDGLQLVEDRTSMPFLQTLLGILKEQKTKRISKVCFTTQGNCAVLARGLDFRERVDATRTALSRPEPDAAGSTGTACVSETTRAAPMGSAEDGAMLSVPDGSR